uniref:uncharacterized protein LOC143401843 n=1 Tax=Callospermophilus lateralis TaxID=76772 RepID=UPI004038ABF2
MTGSAEDQRETSRMGGAQRFVCHLRSRPHRLRQHRLRQHRLPPAPPPAGTASRGNRLPPAPPLTGTAAAFCLWLTLKQSLNVPAFLSKLWTVVEETHSKEFITWSQPLPAPPPAAGAASLPLPLKQSLNVQAFLSKLWTLVEETHSKEFITWSQFFSDGFRKVVQIIDSGIVKQERDGPVEFQHPYFKQGQDDLLENIKRKQVVEACGGNPQQGVHHLEPVRMSPFGRSCLN